LYDTLGNVLEWCADSLRTYTSALAVNPNCGPGQHHVFRGGSWGSDAKNARAAYRGAYAAVDRHGTLGFRLARDP
jgi:formylglycine-generating enzyme required for sulfatase activity